VGLNPSLATSPGKPCADLEIHETVIERKSALSLIQREDTPETIKAMLTARLEIPPQVIPEWVALRKLRADANFMQLSRLSMDLNHYLDVRDNFNSAPTSEGPEFGSLVSRANGIIEQIAELIREG
jgi:hypothetical protein